MNADSDEVIGELLPGTTLYLDQLPSINVVAVSSEEAESVEFSLNNQAFSVENVPPYALAGDTSGDYKAWTPSVGNYLITARAFSEDKTQGDAGLPFSIAISVVGSSGSTTTSTTTMTTTTSASLVTQSGDFNALRGDFLSLHYDHAPDKDDGHSAAADRTILETDFNCSFLGNQMLAVGGTYGRNKGQYNSNSEAVMDVVWGSCGAGWLDAHNNWMQVRSQLYQRWKAVITSGAHVWVKEGGQSNLTAEVVRLLRAEGLDTIAKVHTVQHSNWNEQQTHSSELNYVKANTDYIRIKDANAYLNKRCPCSNEIESFVETARNHPVFGASWTSAFDYYDPNNRVDFSDTGELMWILGLGNGDVPRTNYMGIDILEFGQQYLN